MTKRGMIGQDQGELVGVRAQAQRLGSAALVFAFLVGETTSGNQQAPSRPEDGNVVHINEIGHVTIVGGSGAGTVGNDAAGIPARPSYCVVHDSIEHLNKPKLKLPARLNTVGNLCHPVESPYYSFTRGGNTTLKTLKDCRKKGLELPDVLRRVCIADAADRKQALDDAMNEADAVKAFIQKTHVAVGFQTRAKPAFEVEPSLIVHTVVRSVGLGGMPELNSWVLGPYVALSPPVEFGLVEDSSSEGPATDAVAEGGSYVASKSPMQHLEGTDNASEASNGTSKRPTVGLGVLVSKRPSFADRGFSVGLGYWWGGEAKGIQFVVSWNLVSLPRSSK